ncbi:FeS-binding protein [Wenyingzhuangia fucanilytica]|uniref:FeS-binding protein n=1 Tax=Wenyingzhuangia fucanilytica TaxID=1790137 RepID=A0A1B1Y7X8_9FLAO|nr:4Fe-4S dicluster domain-containing protein [Wenyingzhuangia fucanilytica]ANW96882.1 FeS-binding protein [Wenyingzhuangia fucanilytica]
MKTIKNIGYILTFLGFAFFIGSIFTGTYKVTPEIYTKWIESKGVKSEYFIENTKKRIVNKELSAWELSSKIIENAKASNEYQHNQPKVDWNKIIHLKWSKTSKDFVYPLVRSSATGWFTNNTALWFLLTFGLAIIGGLLVFIPDYKLLGPAGIKNNGIFQHSATNRGIIGFITAFFFIGFYIFLYFFPNYLVNPILAVNGISKSLSGNPASQWFLYGFMYCSVMTVFAVRMFIKYRHNKYQMIRTAVVLFFQIAFAFLIPEILVAFNKPWFDFKNAWPLNYSFFFDWNINQLINSGNLGIFMFVWGVILTLVVVPVMVYFYGKRWYCSWVCGCGGLAETLGDPYRQLSNKSLFSWKVERWLIHGVLLFATIMTGLTLYVYFAEIPSWKQLFLGISVYDVQTWYGFFIGSIFSGVIGTGFYPIMGNRVWCRFGCPLAAYLGFVQRFKSRFRITTNGGQCISCGNCSTYCEQGIDVRSYAQKGQNIVRSSCVGCGICSAVCPRGVLKLENGSDTGTSRTKTNDILLGNDIDLLSMTNKHD